MMGSNGRFFGEGILEPIKITRRFSCQRLFVDCWISGLPDICGQNLPQLVVEIRDKEIITDSKGFNLYVFDQKKGCLVIRTSRYPIDEEGRVDFRKGSLVNVSMSYQGEYRVKNKKMERLRIR